MAWALRAKAKLSERMELSHATLALAPLSST